MFPEHLKVSCGLSEGPFAPHFNLKVSLGGQRHWLSSINMLLSINKEAEAQTGK